MATCGVSYPPSAMDSVDYSMSSMSEVSFPMSSMENSYILPNDADAKVQFLGIQRGYAARQVILCQYECPQSLKISSEDYIGIIEQGIEDPKKCLLTESLTNMQFRRDTLVFNVITLYQKDIKGYEFIYVDSKGNIQGKSDVFSLHKEGTYPDNISEVVSLENFRKLLTEAKSLQDRNSNLWESLKVKANDSAGDSSHEEEMKTHKNKLMSEFHVDKRYLELKRTMLMQESLGFQEETSLIDRSLKDSKEKLQIAENLTSALKTEIGELTSEYEGLTRNCDGHLVIVFERIFDLDYQCEAMEKSKESVLKEYAMQKLVVLQLRSTIERLKKNKEELLERIEESRDQADA